MPKTKKPVEKIDVGDCILEFVEVRARMGWFWRAVLLVTMLGVLAHLGIFLYAMRVAF